MTIKEQLQNIAALARELEHCRRLCKAVVDEAVKHLEEGEDIADKLKEPQAAWWERLQRYLAEMAYIDGLMDVYEESIKHRMILRLKYYEALTWEQVTQRMHYSDAHVRRLHDAAIQRLEEARRWEQMDIEDVEGA